MALRYHLITGLALIGIGGCLLFSKGEPPVDLVPAAAELALPDLDEDGKAERLQLLPAGADHFDLQLISSAAAKKHEVFRLAAKGPLHFLPWQGARATHGNSAYELRDEGGRRALLVRLFKQETTPTPDLIMSTASQAKRFLFIERGFLKLDAHEVIPGFSVGLLMLGDSAALLDALGETPAADGTWRLPLTPPLDYTIQSDAKKRLTRLTYHSELLAMKDGMRVGVPFAQMAAHFPGRRKASHWLSPRYGIIGHLGQDDRIQSISIARPWKDETNSME